ncbi:MAG: hypothetical protein DSY33_02605 [Archaeoglobus sp.]|jgi:CBS domain containing-hemolysin-like protein|nr:MAG: hypothetical protein DSY33_02605 [Archaeoglobus sp.]
MDLEDIEDIIMETVDEEDVEEDEALAEILKLANKLVKLLDGVKSYEIREAASLTLIKELVQNDEVLRGLATKMLQDMCYGMDDDENYVS